MSEAPVFNALTQPLGGFHGIEASAGTGKTYSITVLWLRLLIEQHLRVDQVLVTTFTRAATAELQERLLAALRKALAACRQPNKESDEPEALIVARAQPRLGSDALVEHLEAALSNFDLAPIHTIHGFCQSLIGRHSLELGCDPNLELVEDAGQFLVELVGDELMRRAETDVINPVSALQVAKAAVTNPLARILESVTRTDVEARIGACLAPVLACIEQLQLPTRSKNSILRKVELLRDTGQLEKLSESQCEQLGSRADQILQTLAQVRALHESVAAAAFHPIALMARDQFSRRKLSASIRTFDDILLTVHQALQLPHAQSRLGEVIRARFRAVIVDECQDSDNVQIGVFQRLFSTAASFLVIGDPKQSIYRFRGADLSSYRNLAKGANRASGMTRNYRSDAALVEALNSLYGRHPLFGGGTTDDPIRYVPISAVAEITRIHDPQIDEPLLVLWSDCTERVTAKRDLARQTATEFRRLLDSRVKIVDRTTHKERQVRASDLAVLATSHDDLAIVRRELQLQGIPCEQAGASLGSVWSSDEALDVHAWLKAVDAMEERLDPSSTLLAFAATPLLGLSAKELELLHQDPLRQAALARDLVDDASALHHDGPLRLLQRFWAEPEGLSQHLRHRDGERQLTNWRQIGCLLQQEWAQGRRSAADLGLWLSRQRGLDSVPGNANLMKLETDLPAVQLATVYAAKGLEYPIVCCPFLWHVGSRTQRRKAPFALVRRPREAFMDVGSEQFTRHLEEALRQEDEERERVLYVALTRARHRLYLGVAPVQASPSHDNGAERSALAALLGLDTVALDEWFSRCPVPRLSVEPSGAIVPTPDAPRDSLVELATAPDVPLDTGPLTRTTSYSALTRAEDGTARDYDPDDPTSRAKEPGLLADLNLTGNRLGQRVHLLLEDIIGNGRTLESAAEHLSPEWRTVIETILHTPLFLGPDVTTLWELRSRAMAEMHVLLPMRSLTPHNLSEALLSDPSIAHDPERRAWATDVSTWGFGVLAGFFQGYIDLTFEYRGRYYIVDYKTNALGGYGSRELETAMLQHNYLLQARLYALALHRHLKSTLSGYSPEEHLGGCAYLFVRGFPKQGVWFERTSAASIAKLDALFAEATS